MSCVGGSELGGITEIQQTTKKEIHKTEEWRKKATNRRWTWRDRRHKQPQTLLVTANKQPPYMASTGSALNGTTLGPQLHHGLQAWRRRRHRNPYEERPTFHPSISDSPITPTRSAVVLNLLGSSLETALFDLDLTWKKEHRRWRRCPQGYCLGFRSRERANNYYALINGRTQLSLLVESLILFWKGRLVGLGLSVNVGRINQLYVGRLGHAFVNFKLFDYCLTKKSYLITVGDE